MSIVSQWCNVYSIIRLLQQEIHDDKINLDERLIPLIQLYEIPYVYCLYNSNLQQHDVYALFYEEYILNPDLVVTLDDENEDVEVTEERDKESDSDEGNRSENKEIE
jgi:hypothetical protein